MVIKTVLLFFVIQLCGICIETPNIYLKEADVCIVEPSTIKRWMDYRSVTDISSRQYAIISQSTPNDFGCMELNGRTLVAVGSGYGDVGDAIYIWFNDKRVPAIIGDLKQDRHTLNGEGYYGYDGHVVEIIVDSDILLSDAIIQGDCNVIPYLSGEVIAIETGG